MPTGDVVDGDQVLGILALDRLSRDDLPGGGLVVSVLSNGGLQGVVEAAGGQVVRTPVGDKYILEGMQVSGAVLGGEKSGHVIILEHTTSGDGIVTAYFHRQLQCDRVAILPFPFDNRVCRRFCPRRERLSVNFDGRSIAPIRNAQIQWKTNIPGRGDLQRHLIAERVIGALHQANRRACTNFGRNHAFCVKRCAKSAIRRASHISSAKYGQPCETLCWQQR